MSSKINQKFLDSAPVTKVSEYKECLKLMGKRGRPSKNCAPIRKEYHNFIKKEFLDSAPVTKVSEYKECLKTMENRGRPSKNCAPIRKEYNNFMKASKNALKSKEAPVVKAPVVKAPVVKASIATLPTTKAKKITVAEKCKKTSIAECKEPCKVYSNLYGEYCRKSKTKAKKPSGLTINSLSMMA